MKVSKETKILAILLALFLLIGIGCGVAVATGDSGKMSYGPIWTETGTWISTPAEASALVESAVYDPENHPDKGWFNTHFEYHVETTAAE